MTKKKLELNNLELNDAMGHLEEKAKEIEDMKFEMVTYQNKSSYLWLFTYNHDITNLVISCIRC